MKVDLLVVGSGPVGATFARVVSELLPDARILMVDAGPVLTDPPGLNLKNLDDEDALRRARELSQGPPEAARGDAGIPAVDGTITARQGTHLVDPAGAGMPAAAMSTCVGGMGAHWTCATPRPYGSERVPFIPAHELESALEAAERLLATTTMAFAVTPGHRDPSAPRVGLRRRATSGPQGGGSAGCRARSRRRPRRVDRSRQRPRSTARA
ncbi:MAG: hypothetical protein ACXVQJ_11450 [Actinomycetota bacterium]